MLLVSCIPVAECRLYVLWSSLAEAKKRILIRMMWIGRSQCRSAKTEALPIRAAQGPGAGGREPRGATASRAGSLLFLRPGLHFFPGWRIKKNTHGVDRTGLSLPCLALNTEPAAQSKIKAIGTKPLLMRTTQGRPKAGSGPTKAHKMFCAQARLSLVVGQSTTQPVTQPVSELVSQSVRSFVRSSGCSVVRPLVCWFVSCPPVVF
jgi:hypothetical protein